MESNLDTLTVLDEGRPIGHVNEDVLRGVDTKVKDVAIPLSKIIGQEESLRDVMAYMLVSKAVHLPVVDNNGVLSGSISYRDIQEYIRNIYGKDDEK